MRDIIRHIIRNTWNYCLGDFCRISYDKDGKKHIDICEDTTKPVEE